MTWNDKPPAPKHGVWEHWSYGRDIEGWSLRCGSMFYADIRRHTEAGKFFGMLNSWNLGNNDDADILMREVDRQIIHRVREIAQPYKLILARHKIFAGGTTEFHGPAEESVRAAIERKKE